MVLFDFIGRRWTLRTIWELEQARRPLTFRELGGACSGVSSSVLARRLHELTDARIVARSQRGYALTDTGENLVTSLQPVLEWPRTWARQFDEDAARNGGGTGEYPSASS